MEFDSLFDVGGRDAVFVIGRDASGAVAGFFRSGRIASRPGTRCRRCPGCGRRRTGSTNGWSPKPSLGPVNTDTSGFPSTSRPSPRCSLRPLTSQLPNAFSARCSASSRARSSSTICSLSTASSFRTGEAVRRLRALRRPAPRRHRGAGRRGLPPTRGAAALSASTATAFALAAGSALALRWAYFTPAPAGVAAASAQCQGGRSALIAAAFLVTARWLAGFTIGIGGWVLYVAALSLGTLSLVQCCLGWRDRDPRLARLARLGGVPLSGREWGGVGLAIVSLVLLAVSLAGSRTTHPFAAHASWGGIAAWMAVSGRSRGGLRGTVCRGFCRWRGAGDRAGLCYAAGDVGTKAAVGGGARLLFALPVLAGARARVRLPPARFPARRRPHHRRRRDAVHECACRSRPEWCSSVTACLRVTRVARVLSFAAVVAGAGRAAGTRPAR